MARVACVSGRPTPRGAFRQELLAVGTALAPDDPRRHVVREVAGVPFVIERELFDRAVTGAEVV